MCTFSQNKAVMPVRGRGSCGKWRGCALFAPRGGRALHPREQDPAAQGPSRPGSCCPLLWFPVRAGFSQHGTGEKLGRVGSTTRSLLWAWETSCRKPQHVLTAGCSPWGGQTRGAWFAHRAEFRKMGTPPVSEFKIIIIIVITSPLSESCCIATAAE